MVRFHWSWSLQQHCAGPITVGHLFGHVDRHRHIYLIRSFRIGVRSWLAVSRGKKMKFVLLFALLGIAFADPTTYFQEDFGGELIIS